MAASSASSRLLSSATRRSAPFRRAAASVEPAGDGTAVTKSASFELGGDGDRRGGDGDRRGGDGDGTAATKAASFDEGAGAALTVVGGGADGVDATNAASFDSDDCATVDDIREAVTILEDMERTARRNYGTAHPMTRTTGECLRNAQETPVSYTHLTLPTIYSV